MTKSAANDASGLFEPISINGMTCRNRFVRAATYEAMAQADGHFNDDLIALYRDLAAGGVGTIITGYAHVLDAEQPNPNMMGIYDDSFIADYCALADAVHAGGANLIAQIAYGGANTSHPVSPVIWGPSAVYNERSKITPVAMTCDDIQVLEQAFADAARRVRQAGCDGVELHAAHGYLYSAFLTPYFNRRTDEYGGALENRARIICETIRRMREAVGPDFPILAKMNCEDFMERDGLTAEDACAAALLMQEAGADAIEVSGGNDSAPEVRERNLTAVRKDVGKSASESYFASQAARLAHRLDVPIILTGGNRSCKTMASLLDDEGISMFALSRPFIREPDLVRKWRNDPAYEPLCISCNGCHSGGRMDCVFNRS